jgi:KDO2-lipid IV(A) lauroyltransferase
MQAIAFYLTYPIIWVVARLPFPIIYALSDCVYFLLFYVIKYRREVIYKNLKIAFPDHTPQELQALSKQSTRHFSDIFFEMIKSTGISKEEVQRRFTCDNVDEINAFAKAKQPIVLMLGHQASYEWTIALDDFLDFRTYVVYKPIKNKYFDQLIRDVRSKFGSSLIPMKRAYSIIRYSRNSNEVGQYALVADQSPKPSSAQFFTMFFNKVTPVFKGGERMAQQYGMPVYFMRVEKVKRGYYRSRFEMITPDASKEADWQVTDSFFKKLEDQIKKQPALYLWSHKRWKTTPEKSRRAVELSPRVPQ